MSVPQCTDTPPVLLLGSSLHVGEHMDNNMNPEIAQRIPLLVIGISLNTLGIVMDGLGLWRITLIVLGIGMMLAFLLQAMRIAREAQASDDDATRGH